ncbi:hypothetical protein GEMRC1_004146 [Eukaryota sp. GEM-RC1]
MQLLNFLTRNSEFVQKFKIKGAAAGYTSFDASIGLRMSKRQQLQFGSIIKKWVDNNWKYVQSLPGISEWDGTLVSFDNLVTSKMMGFSSAAEYYTAITEGCTELLPNSPVPLLLFCTKDDPVTKGFSPKEICSDLSNVLLVEASEGGHLGTLIRGENRDVFSQLVVEFMEFVK